MKIVYMSHISRSYVLNHPNYLFVFGDNDARMGYGGLAKEVRGVPNSLGIRVKKYPSMSADSFYNDKEFESQKRKIDEDINSLVRRSVDYESVVFPLSMIGTGLAVDMMLRVQLVAALRCGYDHIEGHSLLPILGV